MTTRSAALRDHARTPGVHLQATYLQQLHQLPRVW